MATVSVVAGVVGFVVAKARVVWLIEPLRSKVPASKHVALLADLWAHFAAYAVGLIGGLAVCGWVFAKRRQAAGALGIDLH
jgi:hypothetical protein